MKDIENPVHNKTDSSEKTKTITVKISEKIKILLMMIEMYCIMFKDFIEMALSNPYKHKIKM